MSHSVFSALILSCCLLGATEFASAAAPVPSPGGNHSKLVFPGPDGRLHYKPYTDEGDTIPDFSNCGYRGGGVALPGAAVKVTLDPQPDSIDDTARIQRAIDHVSKLPAGEGASGQGAIRGAVLLKRGRYPIAGQLHIAASGVVLRGEGNGADGTVLIAAGKRKRDLIDVKGPSGVREASQKQKIIDEYVPVGARSFHVADSSGFKVGDEVIVTRIGNRAWIHFIKMDQITPRPTDPKSTKQWQPFDLMFDRVITKIEPSTGSGQAARITVDAPIVCAIDEKWGGGTIGKYEDPGRIENVGIENLRGDSEFDPSITKQLKGPGGSYPADEDHAMYLASFDNAKNCWERNCTAIHFYHGPAAIRRQAKWITVQDCTSLDPVSIITGGRRYPFMIEGQQILMQRDKSDKGRHAFVFQSHVCGPNVFLDCTSTNDYATSEPHHRWSVGGLYDNVHSHMAFQDRQWMGSGHGWAGANYVAWNCEGSLICQKPPTAENFAIGFAGKKEKGAFEPRPDGWWESLGRHVQPRSLYLSQLRDRLGEDAVKAIAKEEK
jgi:hypothetical protein